MKTPKTVKQFGKGRKVKFLPEGLFEANEINFVYGKSGVGKTTFLTAIAEDISQQKVGSRFIDLMSFKVLYYASEGYPHVVDKFRKLNPESEVLITGGYLDIGQQNFVRDLSNYCLENNVKLVVIDTLSASLSGGSRNDDSKVNQVYTALRTELCNQGITVVLVGHTGKSGTDPIGSYQWETDVPVMWYITKGKATCKKFRNGQLPNPITFSCWSSEDIQYGKINWDEEVAYEDLNEFEKELVGIYDTYPEEEVKSFMLRFEDKDKFDNAFHNKFRRTVNKLKGLGKIGNKTNNTN